MIDFGWRCIVNIFVHNFQSATMIIEKATAIRIVSTGRLQSRTEDKNTSKKAGLVWKGGVSPDRKRSLCILNREKKMPVIKMWKPSNISF